MCILRQIDGVAIASVDRKTAKNTIKKIGSYMKSPIKSKGLTEIFNSVDISQIRD